MEMKNLIEVDDFDGIKKAIASGADINAIDRTGCTALMRATVKHDEEMVSWLISNNAALNIQDKRGYTALHYAAQDGAKGLPVGLLLIKAGADIEILDENENPPLGYAVRVNDMDFAKYLLSIGAKTNVPNADGITLQDVYGHYFKDL